MGKPSGLPQEYLLRNQKMTAVGVRHRFASPGKLRIAGLDSPGAGLGGRPWDVSWRADSASHLTGVTQEMSGERHDPVVHFRAEPSCVARLIVS